MKTIKTLLVGIMMLVSTAMVAQPMNYNAMRNNARFLTDRMAYTLGINSPLLLDDIYRINYDYIYAINEYLDDIALGYRYDDYMSICAERDFALQMLLGDALWSRIMTYDYFYRPIVFENRRWHFGIYMHDWDRGHYYFNTPRYYDNYRGGHFFAGMRPNRGIGDRGPGMAGWGARPNQIGGNHGNNGFRGGQPDMNHGINMGGQPNMNHGGNMGGQPNVNRGGNMGGQPNVNRGGNIGGQPDMNRGAGTNGPGNSRSQGNVQSSSRGNSYGNGSYGSGSYNNNPSRSGNSSYGNTPSRSGSSSYGNSSRSSSSSYGSSSRSGGSFSGTRSGGSSSGSSSRAGGNSGGGSRGGVTAGRR